MTRSEHNQVASGARRLPGVGDDCISRAENLHRANRMTRPWKYHNILGQYDIDHLSRLAGPSSCGLVWRWAEPSEGPAVAADLACGVRYTFRDQLYVLSATQRIILYVATRPPEREIWQPVVSSYSRPINGSNGPPVRQVDKPLSLLEPAPEIVISALLQDPADLVMVDLFVGYYDGPPTTRYRPDFDILKNAKVPHASANFAIGFFRKRASHRLF